MKFVIDEDISRLTGKVLKEAGHDILDIRDFNLRGSDDDVIFEFAQENKAVLITGDLGFSNILKFPLASHYGILILHLPNEVSTTLTNQILITAISSVKVKDFKGNLIIVEPNRIKIKKNV